MGEVASRLADRVFITNDNPRSEDPRAIAEAVRNGAHDPTSTDIVLDREQAIRRAVHDARAGDTILVAGKGHETTQLVAGRQRPFDDREVLERMLSRHPS